MQLSKHLELQIFEIKSFYKSYANLGSATRNTLMTYKDSCNNYPTRSWDFKYNGTNSTNGSVQTWTAPCTGTFKLETWGAQGGISLCQGVAYDIGAKGGYSYGNTTKKSAEKLYIAVGSKGTGAQIGKKLDGAWNGGGGTDWDLEDDEAGGGGGGATSIQSALISDGQLQRYSSNRSSVLIVAGGGGAYGAGDGCVGGRDSYYVTNYGGIAGAGGGDTGGKGIYTTSQDFSVGYTLNGATQTTGFGFGLGQTPNNTKKANELGSGGGGWYGGYSVPVVSAYGSYGGGSGGSGYIGGVMSAATIAGDKTVPKPEGGNETGHSGNGYARITIIE